MDLLDKESAILELMAEKKATKKKGTGRKARDAGLSRFASLNKFKTSVDKYKEKNQDKLSLKKEIAKNEIKKSKKVDLKPHATVVEEKQLISKEIKVVKDAKVKTEVALPVIQKSTPEIKETNRVQKGNKQETNRVQKGYKQETIREQIGNLKGNEKGNNFKEKFIPLKSYNTLMGSQKNILDYIFFECVKNGSLTTSRLSVIVIASNCNLSIPIAKTSITRLKKKGFISSIQGKKGRGGWSLFALPKEVYTEIKNADAYTNFQENLANKKGTEKGTKKGTNLSSSSSENLIKKNTTKAQHRNDLPEEWKTINLTNLDQIGFRDSQLLQIFNAGSSFEVVSESLEALRHDIIRKKIPSNVRNALGMVMKLLRVQREPYFSYDKDYISESDQHIADMMKAKKEKALKIKQERDDLFELEFSNWKAELSKEEQKKILGNIGPEGGVVEEMTLKKHFREVILDK